MVRGGLSKQGRVRARVGCKGWPSRHHSQVISTKLTSDTFDSGQDPFTTNVVLVKSDNLRRKNDIERKPGTTCKAVGTKEQ